MLILLIVGLLDGIMVPDLRAAGVRNDPANRPVTVTATDPTRMLVVEYPTGFA